MSTLCPPSMSSQLWLSEVLPVWLLSNICHSVSSNRWHNYFVSCPGPVFCPQAKTHFHIRMQKHTHLCLYTTTSSQSCFHTRSVLRPWVLVGPNPVRTHVCQASQLQKTLQVWSLWVAGWTWLKVRGYGLWWVEPNFYEFVFGYLTTVQQIFQFSWSFNFE